MKKYYDKVDMEIFTEEQIGAFWTYSEKRDFPDYEKWLNKATGENGTLVPVVGMTIYEGKQITNDDMADIAGYMDDDIREELHLAIAPCTNEEFLTAYLAHDPQFIELIEDTFKFEKTEN